MKKSLVFTIGFFLCCGLSFFVFSLPAQAQENILKEVWLDEATITKGYTIENLGITARVGIQPQTFNEPAWVEIKHVVDEEFNLPLDKTKISDVFVYNVIVEDPQVLAKVVWVALTFDQRYSQNIQLAFYNRVTASWQFVPTSIKNGFARAGLPFPYSRIAVFSTQKLAGQSLDSTDPQAPDISAISAVVIDEVTGQILYEKNKDEKRSIASLSKIITAWIFLEQNPDLSQIITYNSQYETNPIGAHLYVTAGDQLTLEDIFYAMLVGSCNNAAKTLGYNTSGLSFDEFVFAMNQKALDLGLTQTEFHEPSGLNPDNQSTAYEYALLAREALKKEKILIGTTLKSYNFNEIYSADWRTNHVINNANQLLNSSLYVTGTKTGFLYESLYTYMIRAKDRETNNEVIVVLLGEESSNQRWVDAENLVNYGLTVLNAR